MREILFRGKATNRDPNYNYRTNYKNGDWVYGLLADEENYRGFAEMTNTYGVSGIEVDKNTVGQYTGLTDKNGKKIFEGDIVAAYNAFGECTYTATAVKWNDFFAEWSIGKCQSMYSDGDVYSYKVIGNIHDNPELLKGGAE